MRRRVGLGRVGRGPALHGFEMDATRLPGDLHALDFPAFHLDPDLAADHVMHGGWVHTGLSRGVAGSETVQRPRAPDRDDVLDLETATNCPFSFMYFRS